jgi:antitoxin (DNA-binding transcriptional repressor) of toxin-antitoxin stability system
MQTIPVEEAGGRLAEIIDHLMPGENVLFTRNGHPVARLVAEAGDQPRPVPGRGKGMLIVVSEDDEHLKDFAEYMP